MTDSDYDENFKYRCRKCKCNWYDDDDYEFYKQHLEEKLCQAKYKKYYKQMYTRLTNNTDWHRCNRCNTYIKTGGDEYSNRGRHIICKRCYDNLFVLFKSLFTEELFYECYRNIGRPNIECLICVTENPTFTNGHHEGLYLNGDEDVYICQDCFEQLPCCKYDKDNTDYIESKTAILTRIPPEGPNPNR